jgi:hypothetical protein
VTLESYELADVAVIGLVHVRGFVPVKDNVHAMGVA